MTNTPSSYDDHEEILSSKWPIYKDLMNKFNESIDGQEKAKAKFAHTLLDINNDFNIDEWPLKTIVLSWPEAQQKIELIESTAEYLLWDKHWFLYTDCQENPDKNPLLSTTYAEISHDDEIQWNQLPQEILVPTYRQERRWFIWQEANNNNTLHKISKKYEGFGILYFDNIDSLNNDIREHFLQMIKKNHNILTLTTEQWSQQYKINFNNTIIVLSYNTTPEHINPHHVGFKTSFHSNSTPTDKTHIINTIGKHHMDIIDDIIPFEYLNTEEKNQYINRLSDTLQWEIKEQYEGKISIDLSPELLENFKTEIKGIDTDTEIISKKWKKNVVSKIGALLKNNKSIQTDYSTITISVNDDGSLIWKLQNTQS